MKNISTDKYEKGFTLVECIISMVIVLIGLSAITSLLVICLKTESMSRQLANANYQARSKVEELQNASRVVGGDLTADITNYFDYPAPNYVRRWQISADPMGTQTVSVVMIPTQTGAALSEIRLTTRMK